MPEGWAWSRLGEIVEVLDSQRKPITKSERKSGIYPYYGATCIQDYVSDYLFDEDLLLLGEDGAKWGAGDLSAFCISGKTWVNNHAHVLRPKNGINIQYLCNTLIILDLSDFITGTTVPKLNQEKMSQIMIPLPSTLEQNKINLLIKTIIASIDKIEKNRTELQTSIKQTKSKILDLAIHGKLVPQDVNDEPASVLLEKLRAEKEDKIAKGEIKRDKNDSYIYKGSDNCYYQRFADGREVEITEELPFDLPDSWSWCRLGDIFTHTTGKALKKSNNKGSLRKYITTSNLYWNSFDFNEVRTMYFTDDELDKCTAKKEDILLCNGGDVGRAAIWNYDYDICIQNHISRLRPKILSLNNYFYLYVIQYNKERGNLSGKGIGITSLSAKDILSLYIPLPPIAEQRRIVSKIKELYMKLECIQNNIE